MSKKHRDIPHFNSSIIETHCHLDYLKEQELATILRQSIDYGIERIITIAVSPDNLASVRLLANDNEMVWATQGIHPHEAAHYSTLIDAEIRQHCSDPFIVAVGEIGLDYYYEHSDRNTQLSVFEQQLQIAVDQQLPVVIHTREAEEDTQAILRNFRGKLVGGVIHSFTSSLALAEFCLDEGFHIGFNGITTFNRADNVREVVAATPVEKIVLETDAPYLTPVPYRGRENAPCYLPFIAEKIAEIKQRDINELLPIVYENSLSLFFNE